MSNTNSTKYTYANFARDIIALVNGELELTEELRGNIENKANDLLTQQESKARYNASHKSASKPKGASPETMVKVNAIAKVLSATPMTASEIAKACNTDYTALQVANAVKYIDGIVATKVIRKSVNSKGLTAEKEYTAYSIG